MRTLIVFLGRPDGTYHSTQYLLPDGAMSLQTRFFFHALWHYLVESATTPDQLVVIGSAGSHWSSLSEFDPQLTAFEDWDALEQASNIDLTHEIQVVERALSDSLGCVTRCILVPADITAHQDAILTAIADCCGLEDELHIDVTHGYRHYGQLAVQAAFFLRQVRDAKIGGVYYGQYDKNQPRAVLLTVDELASWSEALAIMRHTGRLVPVARLLPRSMSELARLLEEIEFGVQASRFAELSARARRAHNLIDGQDHDGLPAPLQLALLEIADELDGYTREHVADLQLDLARRAGECGDWMRCGMLLYEAVCSAAVRDPSQRLQHLERQDAWKLVTRPHTRDPRPVTDEWVRDGDARVLEHVRNTLAHGSLPRNRDTRRKLESAAQLQKFLRVQLRRVPAACVELQREPLR